MSCEWTQGRMDAYELGQVSDAERECFEEHLASCEACRTRLEQVRASDEAARAAFAWAEPDARFAQNVLARLRPASWRPWAALAAGAAVLCIALLSGFWSPRREPEALTPHAAPVASDTRDDGEGDRTASHAAPEAVAGSRQPDPARTSGGPLVYGALLDPSGLVVDSLEHGQAYEAAAPSAVPVGKRSLLVIDRGTQFASGPYAKDPATDMRVRSGTMLGLVGGEARIVAVELAPEVGGALVRTRSCLFYSRGIDTRGLGAMALPRAALGEAEEEICLSVLAGELDIHLGGNRLRLAKGDSCIVSCGVTPGPARVLLRRVEQLRRKISPEVVRRRRLYQRLCAGYGHRLLELRATTGPKAPAHHGERIALVERLLQAHAKALGTMEGDHPGLFELEAAEAELRRLELLREEAGEALDWFLQTACSAG